jgi:uncharacterized protein (DUF427 family)
LIVKPNNLPVVIILVILHPNQLSAVPDRNRGIMVMKAIWNNTIIAESDETVIVEGNHYFPPDSIHSQFFRESDETSVCLWKGTASYYDIVVNGEINQGGAWYYPSTTDTAKRIEGYVAFWRGVRVMP